MSYETQKKGGGEKLEMLVFILVEENTTRFGWLLGDVVVTSGACLSAVRSISE